MQRFQWISCMIQRSCGFQRPIPHTRRNLTHGTVMVPEQKSGTETIAVIQFIIVPYFPDTLRIHSTQQLSFLGKLINGRWLSIVIYQISIHGSHQVKTISIQIIPHFLIDRPKVFLIHHLTKDFHCGKCRSTIFRIETIDTASTRRCRILIVLHRIHLLVRTSVMYSSTFGLHLITSRTIQFIQ